jgi:hypothetical protein
MHDLKLVIGFAFHTVVAAGLFALVGGAAALLHYYTQVLERLDMPALILTAIKSTEYFLFAVDLLCFVVYVSRETWLLLKAMLVPGKRAVDAAHSTDLPR